MHPDDPLFVAQIDYAISAWPKVRHDLGNTSVPIPADWLRTRAVAPGLPSYGAERDVRGVLARRYGVGSDQVAVFSGCQGAVSALALATAHGPRKRVLVERPGFDPMQRAPRTFGCVVDFFERPVVDGRASLDVGAILDAVHDDTAAVWLTDPHNPTGASVGAAGLTELAAGLAERGAVLVVNEIYRDYEAVLGATSAVAVGPNIIVTSSLTKVYGLGSLRFGWVVGPADWVARAATTRFHTTGPATGPATFNALAAVRGADEIRRVALAPLEGRWAELAEVLSPHGLTVHGAEPVPYGLIGGLRDDDRAACIQLLDASGVYLMPGSFLGMRGYARASVSAPLDWRAALDALAASAHLLR